MMRASLVAIALLVTPALSFAADKRDKGAQVVNFEDDTISGDLTKPDGEYIDARKGVEHTNLIRIREEFKDKVLQSVSDL